MTTRNWVVSDPFQDTPKLPPEQEAIRAKCFHSTGTFVEFHKEEIEQSVPERFEKIVRQYPHRPAVKAVDRTLTYAELNQHANRIARAILARQESKAEPVAILLPKGVPQIAAMLGILKAGKFFVLLDPSFPWSRTAASLEDSQAGLVMISEQSATAGDFASGSYKVMEFDSIDASLPNDDLPVAVSPDAMAYVVYTSGSTGEPKGVVQTHRNLLHHVMLFTNAYHLCEHDRVSLIASGTARAVHDTFAALLNGAWLLPFDVQQEGMTRLTNWLRQERISIWSVSSLLFRNFCEAVTEKEIFPDLRLIRLASEAAYKIDLDLYKKTFSSGCLLANGLNTAETQFLRIYLMDHSTEVTGNKVPVGYALDDKEVFLLDDAGREVSFNKIGEIAVRTRYLSPGYWRRPELTEAKFKSDPEGTDRRIYLTGDLGLMLPDGCLIHEGRKDFRVKIRGYGVELAEVENTLRSHRAVREAVVIAPQSKSGEARLIAYFTSSIQAAPRVSELRNFLKEKLPDYMIPSAFVKLESIPLTPNGKVDRKALPEPETTRPELDTAYTPPRSEIEQKLVQIWEEVLGVRPIGIHDNFFDLGGHSLLAAKLFARLDEAFGRSLPLGVLFNAPTVGLLAERYRSAPEPKARSAIVPIRTGGTLPPIFGVPGVFGNVLCFAELSRELGSDQPFYGLQSIGLDGAEAPLDSIESMASLYVSEIRKVQPHGPYALIGACFGARVAYEMARQLLEAEEGVAFLGLLDPSRREGYDTSENAVSKSRIRKRAKALSSFVTDRLQLYLDEMRGLEGAERIKFIASKIRSLTLNIGSSKAFTRIQRELNQLEVFMANKEASKRYHRKPLNGRLRALEIFETSRNTMGWRFDWKSLWGGHPVRHHVPGKDSGDMLRGENAPAVAGLLAQRLRAAFAAENRRDSVVHGR
ncbi:MAG TPA: AMP-binding protein [Candidatus Binatia bacterium]|jgi:amino acid adenylation domain-containing protein